MFCALAAVTDAENSTSTVLLTPQTAVAETSVSGVPRSAIW